MAGGRIWTQEEDLYLEEHVGKFKIGTIAQKLNRTPGGVQARISRLGLDSTKLLTGCLTANELAKLVNIDYHTVIRWIEDHGLKAIKKVTRISAKFNLIRAEEFWKWAKVNKDKINFSRIEPHSIIPEPCWVEEERQKDTLQIPKNQGHKWTDKEDETLQDLITKGYSYQQIGDLLERSKSSVEHRISRLYKCNKAKIKPKKIQLKWSDEELKMMLNLDLQGLSDKDIAFELGREREHIVDIRRRLRNKGVYTGRKSV